MVPSGCTAVFDAVSNGDTFGNEYYGTNDFALHHIYPARIRSLPINFYPLGNICVCYSLERIPVCSSVVSFMNFMNSFSNSAGLIPKASLNVFAQPSSAIFG